MTIQTLKTYYQKSWLAWWFFPLNLSMALTSSKNQGGSLRSVYQAAMTCFYFEDYLSNMWFFPRWLFKDIITSFTESETYKKYLLIPEQVRRNFKNDLFGDYFFPLLLSIPDWMKAKKIYNSILPWSQNNYAIKLSLQSYGLFRLGATETHQGVPQLSLNIDDAPNTPSVTLDYSHNWNSDIQNEFPHLLTLVKSKHCPHDLMIKFPLTWPDDLARSLYKTLQNRDCSTMQIIMGKEVLPMNQQSEDEMLEAKTLIFNRQNNPIKPAFFETQTIWNETLSECSKRECSKKPKPADNKLITAVNDNSLGAVENASSETCRLAEKQGSKCQQPLVAAPEHDNSFRVTL